MRKVCLIGFTVCCVMMLAGSAMGQAPYVGASEADNEFHRITAEDMDIIRSKKMLMSSRSFGLNMFNGLNSLAERDEMYALPARRSAVNLVRAKLEDLPADLFERHRVVHYLCQPSPLGRRLEELNHYLRNEPYKFAQHVDLVFMDYSSPAAYIAERYANTMDQLAEDFPHIVFIMVTGGLHPVEGSQTRSSWAFSDIIEPRYRGKAPLMDWRSLLSTRFDGTSAGQLMVPQFNSRPAGNPDKVHPNNPRAQARLGRAYLVLLWKIYCDPGLIANAGFDRTATLEAGSTTQRLTLDGSASSHSIPPAEAGKAWGKRNIVRYVWTLGDQVLADTDQPTVEVDLPVGEHEITLTVTNDADQPETDTDTVLIGIVEPE